MIVLIATLVAFPVLTGRYFFTGKNGRHVLITGSFTLGALASVFGAWQLVSSQWTLPLWTTLKAAGDAEKYGHPVEHDAEGIVVMLTFAAVLGGTGCAGLAAISTRFLKYFTHP